MNRPLVFPFMNPDILHFYRYQTILHPFISILKENQNLKSSLSKIDLYLVYDLNTRQFGNRFGWNDNLTSRVPPLALLHAGSYLWKIWDPDWLIKSAWSLSFLSSWARRRHLLTIFFPKGHINFFWKKCMFGISIIIFFSKKKK